MRIERHLIDVGDIPRSDVAKCSCGWSAQDSDSRILVGLAYGHLHEKIIQNGKKDGWKQLEIGAPE